ncbi:MAG: DNA gyrase inhibitor YacG [Legionella sp.]
MGKVFSSKCPSCGLIDTWHVENKFRPFCSSRCKLIDFGAWVSESRTIEGDAIDSTHVFSDIPL